MTPIQKISDVHGCRLYMKRDDLYPVSFGGNKARKGELFFRDIRRSGADCVVTYGSRSSNHCRVVANLAAAGGLPCWVVSPEEEGEETANSRMVRLFGARYVTCPVSQVHDTIERTLQGLKERGLSPYFIQGGGHGNTGTQAYVDAYREIAAWEAEAGVRFDYLFHASGTGTTQAGLVCGQLLAGDTGRQVIGISVARPLPRGRDVVAESVRDYLRSLGREALYDDSLIHFETAYICGGYGKVDPEIRDTIRRVLVQEGVPLCGTYTGKAFWGMERFLESHDIRGKNILFIHTGGTPLFFDDLKGL